MTQPLYTVKDISNCLDLHTRTIHGIFFTMNLRPLATVTRWNEGLYSIHQIEALKLQLENKSRAFDIKLDFINNEVNVVYSSKINN